MTDPSSSLGSLDRLGNQPIVRVVAYYVLVFAGTALLVRAVPEFGQFVTMFPFNEQAGSLLGGPSGDASRVPLSHSTPGLLALTAALAMVGAFALMLPVAWVYILTRRKKGFQQSVVQTLIILPIVVAGVVILVKSSLALAFSLGGIVAAVSFRNTLRDTKDAVYIFLSTGLGLACGVQAMTVAAVLSVGFNAIILLLWWTDFGRQPAALQSAVAQRRLQRAREARAQQAQAAPAAAPAGQTTVVSVLDREILRSLTPDQLAALVQRADRRREQFAADLELAAPPPSDGMRPLRVTFSRVSSAGRQGLEALLETETKAWTFVSSMSLAGGGERLEYRVRLRKKVPPATLLEHLRDARLPFASDVDLPEPAA